MTSNNLNLSSHQFSYQHRRDIVHAVLWSSLKKVLEQLGKSELFEHITSISFKDTSITIQTGKPIINTEIHYHKEVIIQHLAKAITPWSVVPEKLTLRFR